MCCAGGPAARWTPAILDDAVATQDTVTQLIGAIRRVRREVPGAAELVAERCRAHDYDDPGKPEIIWNDPAARDALVRDALTLLAESPPGPAGDAVGLLALVAGQDVELVEDGEQGPRWRDRAAGREEPSDQHRRSRGSARAQDGAPPQDRFKAHVAVEPGTGLVTDCALTKASGAGSADAQADLDLLTGETEHCKVLGDSAYGTGEAHAVLARDRPSCRDQALRHQGW